MWRCLDCLSRLMHCTLCFHHCHKHLPFHWVKNWTGSCFKVAWLCQAGLELYLGHRGDQFPSNAESNLYYTENEDTTEGVELKVDNGDNELDANVIFTETELRTADNLTPDLEWLDNASNDGFLLVSVMKPKTAFTFRVLDDFHLTNLECNTPSTSYWHKIVQKTSNVS